MFSIRSTENADNTYRNLNNYKLKGRIVADSFILDKIMFSCFPTALGMSLSLLVFCLLDVLGSLCKNMSFDFVLHGQKCVIIYFLASQNIIKMFLACQLPGNPQHVQSQCFLWEPSVLGSSS